VTRDAMYHRTTPEQAQRRKELAPETHEAFEAFSKAVFADGALPEKTKQLIAVAVAHTTQCPFCIEGHTKLAVRKGASPEEVMEAIWVAAEMRAGGAYAHSTLALSAMEHLASHREAEVADMGHRHTVAAEQMRAHAG
jgi:AhpD family alkylhydroperoxidase